MTHTQALLPTPTTGDERTVAGRPSRETVLRMCGAALTIGGALCMAGGTLHPIVAGKGHSVEALTSPGTPIAQTLLGIGTVLLVLGLPGMYAWLRPRLGPAGFAGTVAYLLGNIVTATGHLTVELFVAYPFASDPRTAHLIAGNDNMIDTTAFALFNSIGGVVMLAGMGLLGASLLRHNAIPRWIAVLTLLGMVGFFLPIPATQGLSGFIYEAPRGIAVAAIGVLMLRSPAGLRRWAARGGAAQDDERTP
ncbi:hypothetical protein [Nocardia implantans]|uniref:DUF4386 family protein n=1 Tax=Nocardia implantans TaxID=3108168 RepID=A0ABU6AZ98_9NOCA|nr:MULTISPECIES: hypothetical protein [unclassified Nocardia]MBF6194097.1 hypothetical protein [Nocardia beijingensis]MEA3529704.1 hypothetical protein [Nocardia sp. CDC192]MEB3512818.1 hypothetical protein [Nocardia sp. CDC186]